MSWTAVIFSTQTVSINISLSVRDAMAKCYRAVLYVVLLYFIVLHPVRI